MDTKLHFSSAKQDWWTPPELFLALDRDFRFTWDAAATSESNVLIIRDEPGAKISGNYYGPDHQDESRRDALAISWPPGLTPIKLRAN